MITRKRKRNLFLVQQKHSIADFEVSDAEIKQSLRRRSCASPLLARRRLVRGAVRIDDYVNGGMINRDIAERDLPREKRNNPYAYTNTVSMNIRRFRWRFKTMNSEPPRLNVKR